jgi:hypothetical protein
MGNVARGRQVPLVFSNFSMAIQEGQANNKSVEYLVAAIFWVFHSHL